MSLSAEKIKKKAYGIQEQITADRWKRCGFRGQPCPVSGRADEPGLHYGYDRARHVGASPEPERGPGSADHNQSSKTKSHADRNRL